MSVSAVTSPFPLLWCAVTSDLLHLLSMCPVPKLSRQHWSPSCWDCCNDGFLSPSGSVYQEEEEVSNFSWYLKGIQCSKIQVGLGSRAEDGESIRNGCLRASIQAASCMWMRQEQGLCTLPSNSRASKAPFQLWEGQHCWAGGGWGSCKLFMLHLWNALKKRKGSGVYKEAGNWCERHVSHISTVPRSLCFPTAQANDSGLTSASLAAVTAMPAA